MESLHFLGQMLCLLMTGLILTPGPAAAGEPDRIRAGDRIAVEYVCKTADRELVAASSEEAASRSQARKTHIYVPPDPAKPVFIEAGAREACDTCPKAKVVKNFEDALHEALAEALEGVPYDRELEVVLDAPEQTDLKESERMVQLARFRKRPKTLKLAREIYGHYVDTPPEPGQKANVYSDLIGKVVAVTDQEVEISFHPEPTEKILNPFGEVEIHDRGGHFEVEILAREGALVRTGPLVGRVAKVEDRIFTLDYTDPFGGRELYCTVRAYPAPEKDAAPPEAMPADVGEPPAPESADAPAVIEEGDVVKVFYTARLQSGEVFHTNMASVAADESIRKVDWYRPAERFSPEILVAGENTALPGLKKMLIGMRAGEQKEIVLPPEEAFGLPLPDMIREMPVTKRIPKHVQLTPQEYVQRFGTFPIEGKEIQFNPYLDARIKDLTEERVELKLKPKQDAFEEVFGLTTVRTDGDEIEIRLVPKIGAPFKIDDQEGHIISSSGAMFTVDYNPPLAGKTIVLNVTVQAVHKGDSLKQQAIPWLTSYDDGLSRLTQADRPMVLVLYAGWCSWSKKLLTESLEDLRLRLLKDRFVWVKVDSSEETDIKDLYEQSSFPMIVCLDPAGEVIKKLSGFRDGHELYQELSELVDSMESGKSRV